MDEVGQGKDTLATIVADLVGNVPARDVVERLRAIEPDCIAPNERAAFLQARGIALNRLGLSDDALGDLEEARNLFRQFRDRTGEAVTSREIARVHAWRAEGREAALSLVGAMAASGQSDGLAFARTIIEAGRLNFETGRFDEAGTLLEHGLDGQDLVLPLGERLRAELLLAQTLVARGRLPEAQTVLDKLDDNSAPWRVRHLAVLERARVALRRHEAEAADALLKKARDALSSSDGSFEDIEVGEVEAECALARGEPARALASIRPVIARFAEDDLAGREIQARLVEAETLDLLGHRDEANDTRLAALRRALGRDLAGHADIVRQRLAQDGQSEFAWVPGLAPGGIAAEASQRFVRRRPLGEGGFGAVSRAYDLKTGAEVALKRLRLAEIYDTADRAKRLAAARVEAAAASRLQHPGIAKVFGLLVESDGEALLVRELIEGPTLREVMQAGLPLNAKLATLTELAQALAAVHAANVVHRDIKPENVVLRRGRHPVIIDFGACAIGAARGGSYSLDYAAPEQIDGGSVDARADVYAFATLAFEVLVGRRPDRAPGGLRGVFAISRFSRRVAGTLTSIGAPPPVADAIARSLAFRPRSRPRSAQELVDALQRQP